MAVDKNAEALQLMVDTDAKIMIALIDNPPDYMGKTSVDIAIAYLSGEAVEAEYTTSGDIIARMRLSGLHCLKNMAFPDDTCRILIKNNSYRKARAVYAERLHRRR